jgi:glycosidase
MSLQVSPYTMYVPPARVETRQVGRSPEAASAPWVPPPAGAAAQPTWPVFPYVSAANLSPDTPGPSSAAAPIPATSVAPASGTFALPRWNNRLKELFQKHQAVIYMLHLRTFGATDRNGDGRISPELGENGTFLSAIAHLDELQALGVNTIHLLPIHPIGKQMRLGEAGSPYAPLDIQQVNPEYGDPRSPLSLIDQARLFIREAHRRGIHVMADIPSCASVDLARARPDLIARDLNGKELTPTNWIDVRMYEDNPALMHYFQGFFNLMVNQLGVDGFRVDIARARPPAFWRRFIQQYPNLAWLGETYTTEDASPLKNLPRDIPEALLVSGFDSIYGQFHIFHAMKNADEYLRYLVDGNAMLKRSGPGKSFIGSFLTHDDPALMSHGGVPMSYLASGLMAFQPWTNPYIVDGFTSGAPKPFDIFTFSPKPTGKNPEIGVFLKQALQLRRQYQDLLSNGVFIPIPVYQKTGSTYTRADNNSIIAFSHHLQGKTLLVVANKDINARHSGTLYIPGMKVPTSSDATLPLRALLSSPGNPSSFTVGRNKLLVNLGAGRFHLFEMDTPELPTRLQSYW